MTFPGGHGLLTSIGAAENYLRTLLAEYESFLPTAKPGKEVKLAELPVLADLVGPYDESVGFRLTFVHPVQQAMLDLRKLVLTREDR
ncbi:hypothetical protein [Actinoplanes sp. RD1]|uniref:hypothetical protein n=1 Tax=Actinoplanes sp. RD1 TaxID=3064538 RepID=UPI0027420E0B|nr:hypothetical protein [Actinoplanes sp. RD1]